MTDDEALALAAEAVAAWGGSPLLRMILNRENAVFAVRLASGPAALRIHRRGYQTDSAIRSELWWMEALADRGLPVPRPVRCGNELYIKLADGRLASAVSWVEGDPVGTAWHPLPGTAAEQAGVYRAVGRLLARVHTETDQLQLPKGFSRPRWDIEGLLGEQPFWGRFWEHPSLSQEEAAAMQDARRLVRDRLTAYAASGGDQGLIHADLMRENLIVNAGEVSLIDFDDCGFGFRLYDLGTALAQNAEEPHLEKIATALADGYAELRELSDAERGLIPIFTLMRTLASTGWAIPRLPAGDAKHRLYIDRALRLHANLREG